MKKAHGHPKKAQVPSEVPLLPLTSCSLFVEVQVDPVVTNSCGGTIKYQEQAPFILGPCMLLFSASWEDLLSLLTKQVYAKSPVCLVVDTMVW